MAQEVILKSSAVLLSIIIALSLAVWCFFYLTSARLQPAETTVVVGFCTLLVLTGKFLWSRFTKPRKNNAESKHNPPASRV